MDVSGERPAHEIDQVQNGFLADARPEVEALLNQAFDVLHVLAEPLHLVLHIGRSAFHICLAHDGPFNFQLTRVLDTVQSHL